MNDVNKYFDIYKNIKQLRPEDTFQLISEAESQEDKTLGTEQLSSDEVTVTSKMRAFLELDKMLISVSQELDYNKELAEARDERYSRR